MNDETKDGLSLDLSHHLMHAHLPHGTHGGWRHGGMEAWTYRQRFNGSMVEWFKGSIRRQRSRLFYRVLQGIIQMPRDELWGKA